MENSLIIKELKKYFKKEPEVLMAFVFGSRAKGFTRQVSDWDIAVYFRPQEFGELETRREYPDEARIAAEVDKLLQTDADFLVLNRARPSLVFTVLNSGVPLVVKDRRLYLYLVSRTHYEALDFWSFAHDFWRIRERSASLSPEDRSLRD